MTSLDSALTGVARLCLDTAPIIYFVEVHPHYDALVTEVFQRIADGRLVGVTSVITLTEVLVQPVQRGERNLQRQYRDLLSITTRLSMKTRLHLLERDFACLARLEPRLAFR